MDGLGGDDSTWPTLLGLLEASPFDVEALTAGAELRCARLSAAQLTTGSMLGALAPNYGAVTIDHGRLGLDGVPHGEVDSWAPDTLTWEPTGEASQRWSRS